MATTPRPIITACFAQSGSGSDLVAEARFHTPRAQMIAVQRAKGQLR